MFPPSAAILDTILTRLATLFLIGTAGDATAARAAAVQMLATYNARTEEELCLAATIIAFGFHSLEALGQACDPELPLTRVLRLRSGAVSLSREADKARRRLVQLQKIHPQPEELPEPIEATAPVQPAKKLTWTQAFQQRQREKNLAARQAKNEARAAADRARNPQPAPIPEIV